MPTVIHDQNQFIALKSLNLHIPKGKFVCIIGEVGAGKSSLLSALIGDMLYLNEHEAKNIDFETVNNLS